MIRLCDGLDSGLRRNDEIAVIPAQAGIQSFVNQYVHSVNHGSCKQLEQK
jgi:hypothetical protein